MDFDMDSGIVNGTGALNAFEGVKTIEELSVGQMFLTHGDGRKVALGIVVSKGLPEGAIGFAYYYKVGGEDGNVIFEPEPCDVGNYPKLPGYALVLAIQPELKVDVSMEHCRYFDSQTDMTDEEEAEVNRLGRLVVVHNSANPSVTCMGVIVSKNVNSIFDTVRLVQTVASGSDLIREVASPSLQFDEWYGVVGDQRVFTVRSRGLCKENQE